MGSLYLVGTPIGNLGDITLRALEVLRRVPLIAAEDTRTTRKLLSHFDIHCPLISYYEHNRIQRQGQILAALASGDVALVSDSGMPSISDPGYHLVRRAIEEGFPVVPVPGPNAAIAALAASGLPTDTFTFVGFLPRQKAQRLERLGELAWLDQTLIFYEAPSRVAASFQDLLEGLGDRRIAVARELTKMHEEIWRGTLSEAARHFSDEPRGEFTLVIEGRTEPVWTEEAVRQGLSRLHDLGLPPADAARDVASMSGWPKSRVYRLGITENSQGAPGAPLEEWHES